MLSSKTGILIVDDDRIILDSLSEFLRLEDYDVEGASSFREATAALARRFFHIIVSDVNMPGADGFELLRVLRDHYPETVAIMITGYGTIESAVEAIKMGAFDYITKPVVDDDIRVVIERALRHHSLIRENHQLRRELNMRYGLDQLVGHDYRMLKVFDLIEAVAASRVTVLIEGESGTGKSMVARAIHHRSDRQPKPFVEVSCGAIPEALLESELFGHVRGAFTGAVGDKIGKFKAADGGTIFLDEISSASAALQMKLLRVLQERQFEPVGSNETQTVDVRVVLATNQDLAAEVEAGRFRQDLYYRVNVVQIQLPSLRERVGDIPALAKALLDRHLAPTRKELLGFTDDARRYLERYAWPGNVRELENVVERAVVLANGPYITSEDLPPGLVSQVASAPAVAAYRPMPLRDALAEPEKMIIEAALKANDWNRQLTAEALDINRTTLYKKMKRYRLNPV